MLLRVEKLCAWSRDTQFVSKEATDELLGVRVCVLGIRIFSESNARVLSHACVRVCGDVKRTSGATVVFCMCLVLIAVETLHYTEQERPIIFLLRNTAYI